MSPGPRFRAARIAAAAILLAVSAVSALPGNAVGEESLSDLQARMAGIQAELNAATARLEELRNEGNDLRNQIADLSERREVVARKHARLVKRAVVTANELYRHGSADILEVLFSSESFAEMTSRAELLSQVSSNDLQVFDQLALLDRELEEAGEGLIARRERLAETEAAVKEEVEAVQAKLASAREAYERLRRLQSASSAPAAPASAPAPISVRPSGGMACPVAGPVSFVDTWGAPRSGGRSHQGVDMMAGYGTPVVAITAGTITYAGYGSSAGNWQILSGDDGNQYWYMHNQQNIVTGGHVSAGQQIATVGDTGNATGVPHLHFEYHPGGGSAVNPTPLVAAVC